LPVILVLVLKLELELLVLEVRQAELGRRVRVANAPRRAACQLRVFAIVALVVGGLSVPKHGHDVGEHNTWSVVLVRVDKDAQALKVIRVAEDIALLAALAGHPHGEAIAIQLVFARDLELDFNLPVGCR
jgi:hypothetical protein